MKKSKLRKQAEAVVSNRSPTPHCSPVEEQKAQHELQVHQVQLEMQNEELRRVSHSSHSS